VNANYTEGYKFIAVVVYLTGKSELYQANFEQGHLITQGIISKDLGAIVYC